MLAVVVISDLNITDADGLPVTNGSTLRVNSRLICSTPYDHNFAFSWTNVYNSSEVIAGNTLTLSDIGFFSYRCSVENFSALKGFTVVCSTGRTIDVNVSSLGIT